MLKDVEEHLLTKTRRQGEARVAEAKAKAEQELKKAEEMWKKKMEQAMAKIEKRLEEERREKISWAHLEERRMLSEARDDILKQAMDMLLEELQAFTKSRKYSHVLKILTERALKELPDGIIHVKEGDKKHFRRVKNKVVEDADIIGGVIVESKDGRVMVDHSFDMYLEKYKDMVRKELYKELFS